MNHHRTDLLLRIPFLCFFTTGNHLFCRRISIAMHQNLTPFCISPFHKLKNLFIRINGIATVSVFCLGIRRTHPCGSALGRTIQKDFIAAYFQVFFIYAIIGWIFCRQFRIFLFIHICNNLIGRSFWYHCSCMKKCAFFQITIRLPASFHSAKKSIFRVFCISRNLHFIKASSV